MRISRTRIRRLRDDGSRTSTRPGYAGGWTTDRTTDDTERQGLAVDSRSDTAYHCLLCETGNHKYDLGRNGA